MAHPGNIPPWLQKYMYCSGTQGSDFPTHILSERRLWAQRRAEGKHHEVVNKAVTQNNNILFHLPCKILFIPPVILVSVGSEAERLLQSRNPNLEHLSPMFMVLLTTGYFRPHHDSRQRNLLKNFTQSPFLPVAMGRGRKEFIWRPLLITASAAWHSREKR